MSSGGNNKASKPYRLDLGDGMAAVMQAEIRNAPGPGLDYDFAVSWRYEGNPGPVPEQAAVKVQHVCRQVMGSAETVQVRTLDNEISFRSHGLLVAQEKLGQFNRILPKVGAVELRANGAGPGVEEFRRMVSECIHGATPEEADALRQRLSSYMARGENGYVR